MPFQHTLRTHCIRFTVTSAVVLLLAIPAWAGGGFFRNGAVGGIAIDSNGVVSQPTREAGRYLVDMMHELVQPAEGEMNESTELRRISLRKLSEALAESARDNTELPADIKYLAGLQRVRYVFVYPEQNDIVLAGPGEGWRVTQTGEVVGRTSGQPVLQLDDLLVALRTSQDARRVGVSCSIDPREEGVREMNKLMKRQRSFNRSVLPKIEKAMGAQEITITGVPDDSHFARVLVAADYRMKRIAMDLEQSPMRELPSFLDMMARSRAKITNMMPRWWLACDYEPMARTEDGLGWELRGPGVKAMTDTDFVAADGTRTATGRKSSVAQKWADTMTANYDELAQRSPIFGQLRNLMDLCVIAAVIDRNNLDEVAGCDLSGLTGTDVTVDSWNAPKTVSTQCSFTKRGREYLITASGGVQIESWQAAEKSEVDPQLSKVYAKANSTHDTWWK